MTAKKIERLYAAAATADSAAAEKIAAEIVAIEAAHGICIQIEKKEVKMGETVETLKEELKEVMAKHAAAQEEAAKAVKWERANCAGGSGHAERKQDEAREIFNAAWEIDKKICAMTWTLEETNGLNT